METSLEQAFGRCPKLPWMIEFHSTADGTIFNNQLTAAFADNQLEHLSSLNYNSKPARKRLTQFNVVFPPNATSDLVDRLLRAGMTTAVIRMKNFTVQEVGRTIDLLKTSFEDFGRKVGRVYPVAIALDVTEPEILIGRLPRASPPVELEKGKTTKLTSNINYEKNLSKEYIYVGTKNITKVVSVGDEIVLGNEIHLAAIEICRDIVECLVEKAGMLSDNLAVTLPNCPRTLPEVQLQEDYLKAIAGFPLDIVFVGPHTIQLAKQILGKSIMVIVKIENSYTAYDIDLLWDTVDGVLMDGEKMVVTCKESVCLHQKSIVAKCNEKGKPCIVTVDCHTLTKSEVCDIYNSINDGVDALLLPADPDLMESISNLSKLAEAGIYQRELFNNLSRLHRPPIEPIMALSIAAVETSFNSNAAAIILLTTSGRTAKLISRFRPRCPIIAMTRFGRIAKQLMVFRAVLPMFYIKHIEGAYIETMHKNMQLGMTLGKVNGYIKGGDAVVILFGIRQGVGFKNCMEVVYASEYDTKMGS